MSLLFDSGSKIFPLHFFPCLVLCEIPNKANQLSKILPKLEYSILCEISYDDVAQNEWF